MIKDNLKSITENIKAACEKSNRKLQDVKLIAVSKKQRLDVIKEAKDCGVNQFGENYVQELQEKYTSINNFDWHFIGHLQSNKAKVVAPMISMLHSLDRLSLAEKLNKALTHQLPVLVQVNVSGESSKEGVSPEQLSNFLKKLESYEHLQICGLMTMPPWAESAEDSRKYFAKLKTLLEKHKPELSRPELFKELSMGTSQDYPVAVEEGATYIRLGSVLLGQRK
ncbi:MAG: YggS family pyridoxal phosphate-dependent enzyme [Bdellovibrionales bacterium]|nr:YggS family pyridoxal phosphate-dependent enzyme [Bdellovibrionales bacterium]